jgi:D-2-hydroxyacid dehydrogenase (NADP+)
MSSILPSRDKIAVVAAHPSYQIAKVLKARAADIACVQVFTRDELKSRINAADVLVASGTWNNDLIPFAPRLKFIQSVSAGTDNFDRAALQAHGVRLASAAGVNARAVAEHAMAMLLALTRQLHQGRDNQAKKFWRGMNGDIPTRENEIGGKTMLIVGLGRIGSGIARRAKAFDVHVVAVRRDPQAGHEGADEVYATAEILKHLPRADVIVLACPLTPETENLISSAAFDVMKRTAILINVARGRVVDEAALLTALQASRIGAAGLDVTTVEPLPDTSPLWTMPNVLITPHTAGETQAYEERVIDLLLENLDRLWRGESKLVNEVA